MTLASIKPVASSSDAVVKLVRRLRAVRLAPSAPNPLVAFHPDTAACTQRANEFLDHVAELPLATWLATGRTLCDDIATLDVRQRAWDRLSTAIASHGLNYAAWSMRDAVETVVFLKTRELRDWGPAERRHFASAHGAAEAATLAVLARDHLKDEDFRVLVASFAHCINSR